MCKVDRCNISYTNNLDTVYMLNEYIVCTMIIDGGKTEPAKCTKP